MKSSFDIAVSRRTSRRSQRGVALVVTLIMLAVITFMAVTFLVLSQRERSAVTGTTDTKIARDASDSAFARVSTELLTRMLLQSNFQDFNMLVSTNYINSQGLFNGNPGTLSPTNVNYDYLVGGAAITAAQDRNINIASLEFNPRPPVFVVTNVGTGAGEFRYYLDLNRNGRAENNGNWPVVVVNAAGTPQYITTNALGQFVVTVATNVFTGLLTNTFVGDPEWIGVLEHPQQLHSADNHFISRYAYVVVPIGKTLDVNTMHNQSLSVLAGARSALPTTDGYLRNQGVGPWELNLAAFLADLNTNMWCPLTNVNFANNGYYNYNEALPSSPNFGPNLGVAFDDARSILKYRYANNFSTLSPANTQFLPASLALQNGIDLYSDGPRMLTPSTNENAPPDNTLLAWPGADNTNHYFSHQDLFDPTKTEIGVVAPGFVERLRLAGTSNDTYNAYTYYRLLSQLGTDSAADQGKININFKNTDNGGSVIPGLETNLNNWTAIDFFTNAATAMFRQMNLHDLNGIPISITNIPVYEDPLIYNGTNINYYTPAVHRVLQLAANMFDTMTNRFLGTGPTNYPTVFRPIFRSANGIATIIGYQEVINPNDAFLPMLDATNFIKTAQPLNNTANIYGVPWVIGAKKGFPNFNEFTMDNPLTVSRDLQFTNSTPGPKFTPWITNQVYNLSITNSFGMEAWNSYTNAYGRSLRLVASNELSILITNEVVGAPPLLQVANLPFGTDTNFTGWPGWSQQLADNSFKLPLMVSANYTNGTYVKNAPFIVPISPPKWDAAFQPHLWMSLQFKMRFVLIDTTANRILDFVNLSSVQPVVDIPAMLNNTANGFENESDLNAPWDTNFLNHAGGIIKGIDAQINIGDGMVTSTDFQDPSGKQTSRFYDRLLGNNVDTNFFQDPYAPHRTIHQIISWQVNDPLVHYTMPDVTSTNGQMANYNLVAIFPPKPALTNLGAVNFAYQPWGGYHLPNGSSLNAAPFDYDVRVKDPALQQSDNWDFPTNKLPNIGWLGRVHRGTPWQTVFMKPSFQNVDQWRTWNNDNITVVTNAGFQFVDAYYTHPTADYGLFDLFTTSVNDNAARGRLDVNQTNLAAWSAVLSGVSVLTNSPSGIAPLIINPAGVYNPTNPSPVALIVMGNNSTNGINGINGARANINPTNGLVFLNNTFQRAGDVLAAPQLTVASPFLNTVGMTNNNPGANGINDEIMERIPQQVMSLLTLNQTPRFVIYSFGQTLHPADHSLVVGGTFNGLCTNYQITAESATRAVVRVEGSPDPQYTNDLVHPHPDPQGRFYPPHIVVEQFNVLGPD